MCPMEVFVHVMAFITIADVHLVCGGFPPALPNPMTDYTIARNVLMSACSCIRRWCSCSEMMACFTRLQIFWVRHIGGGHLWHVWSVSLRENSTLLHWLLHQWYWPGRCPIRSKALREASLDFSYHRKLLLKISANHLDDFQGDWYFQLRGFVLANNTSCFLR